MRVISSPRIERVEVSLEFPEYTRRPAETLEELTLTVPEGTRIKWKLALDRAVKSAEFRPVEGAPVALAVSPNGRSVTMAQVASSSRAYSFGWVGKERGFAFSSPRHYLQVAPDRAPGVELTSPRGLPYATLERRLDFAFRGRDDHGIGAGDRIDLRAVADALGMTTLLDEESAVLAVSAPAADRRSALRGRVAPDFTLPDLDGNLHSLEEFKDRKRLLIAFASW